jgi:DNA-binding LacI/PurR family transcriptional regulator
MAHLAIAHLVEQGCRSIGIWLSNDHNYENYSAIFRSTLQKYGLDYEPALVKAMPSVTDEGNAISSQEQGYRMAYEVFRTFNGPRPDGLFLSGDMTTAGALVALNKLHVAVGDDLKIATHANKGSPMLFGMENDLILLEIDPAEIVQAMFAQMNTLLTGHKPADKFFIKPHVRIPH